MLLILKQTREKSVILIIKMIISFNYQVQKYDFEMIYNSDNNFFFGNLRTKKKKIFHIMILCQNKLKMKI